MSIRDSGKGHSLAKDPFGVFKSGQHISLDDLCNGCLRGAPCGGRGISHENLRGLAIDAKSPSMASCLISFFYLTSNTGSMLS